MMFGSVVGSIILCMVLDWVDFRFSVLLCSDCGMVLMMLFESELIKGISMMFMIRFVVIIDDLELFRFSGCVK